MLAALLQQSTHGQENVPQQLSIKLNSAPLPHSPSLQATQLTNTTPKQARMESSGAFIIAVSSLTCCSVLALQSYTLNWIRAAGEVEKWKHYGSILPTTEKKNKFKLYIQTKLKF